MTQQIFVPLRLPDWLYRTLRGIKRAALGTDEPALFVDITGERNIEWSFLSAEMPCGPGEAIEFGCEFGYMSLLAAEKGFCVLANDLLEQHFSWRHPKVKFVMGDFLKLDLPRDYFDLAINCSSVEHVGVAGRYGIKTDQDDGDIRVMRRLAEILKPEGKLLMTAPCGRDAILAPWCRVYGQERLPRVLAPFRVEKERYWIKNEQNQWIETSRGEALDFQPLYNSKDPHRCAYSLAGFVLQKLLSDGVEIRTLNHKC